MFKADAFRAESLSGSYAGSDSMTIQGTAIKTGFLVLVALATGLYVWTRFDANPASAMPLIMTGLIGGLIIGLVTSFVPRIAKFTAPIYAGLEGLCLGGVSAYLNVQFPGIAIQAFCLTFGILFTMCVAYQSGVIRATPRFKKMMFAAMAGVCLLFLINFVASFFGSGVPFIFGMGPIGIIFSIFLVGLASFTLILDFDFIESASNSGAPKSMEWYGAFSLMVTLVWLYIEVIRLLAILQSRD